MCRPWSDCFFTISFFIWVIFMAQLFDIFPYYRWTSDLKDPEFLCCSNMVLGLLSLIWSSDLFTWHHQTLCCHPRTSMLASTFISIQFTLFVCRMMSWYTKHCKQQILIFQAFLMSFCYGIINSNHNVYFISLTFPGSLSRCLNVQGTGLVFKQLLH